MNSSNGTIVGSRILYSCKRSPEGQGTYTCDRSGAWRDEEGAKLPTCLPDLDNGTQSDSGFQSTGTTAKAQAACGEETRPFPSHQKRIVGGRTAFPGLFPWQVLLSVEDTARVPTGRWFGSGALLSPSWVLTAAHVLRRQLLDMSVVPVAPTHVQATLGLTDVRDKSLAVNRSVETIILHPEFDPNNYNNDIALVKLSQDVVLTELVRPVCLPAPWVKGQSRTPEPNTLGVVAGWGINMPNSSALDNGITFDLGVVSEVLQYVKLPVVAQDECQASYASRSSSYNITENMFCAGFYEGGRDTCLGDSGGGFVIKDPISGRWVVQGLVSWGGPEGCGSRHVYGVYTRVANYATWLQNTMNTECWW